MDIAGHSGQISGSIAQSGRNLGLERSLEIGNRTALQSDQATAPSLQSRVLLIVRGVDGVGRTQLLQWVRPDVVVDSELQSQFIGQQNLSTEDLQAEVMQWMLGRVQYFMRDRHALIGVSGTFSQRCEIAPFLGLAEQMGYSVQVVMAEAVTVVENGVNRLVECGESSDELRQFKESWEPFDPAIESGIITRGFTKMIQSMNNYKGDAI
jgi:hypothetical protein